MTTLRPPIGASGHGGGLDYHRTMLEDLARVDAYERGIRALVRPGDVVLDLGAGTGLLSMLAARAGARKVYAVESMPVAGLARALVAENGLSDRVEVIQAEFTSLTPPEPVDLVISEFMGRFVEDDGMLPVVEATARWMKPDARFCPGRVDLLIAPVGGFHLSSVDHFERPMLGLKMGAAWTTALHNRYGVNLRPDAPLAEPALFHRLEPPHLSLAERPLDHQAQFTLRSGGRLRGVAGWFLAQLAPNVSLDTGPGHTTHWGQLLFPTPTVITKNGDVLDVHIRLDTDHPEQIWRWSGRLQRGGETLMTFDLSSDPAHLSQPPTSPRLERP